MTGRQSSEARRVRSAYEIGRLTRAIRAASPMIILLSGLFLVGTGSQLSIVSSVILVMATVAALVVGGRAERHARLGIAGRYAALSTALLVGLTGAQEWAILVGVVLSSSSFVERSPSSLVLGLATLGAASAAAPWRWLFLGAGLGVIGSALFLRPPASPAH